MSHSEAIAGVRVKRFLTLAIMKLAQALLNQSNTPETRQLLETTILDLVKSSFALASTDNPLSQAKLFLGSLGFSPCEVEWVEDVRIGRVLLGKGRLWKPTNDQEMELMKLLLLSIIKGIGYSFLKTKVRADFIEEGMIPPRFSYEIQFRASEDVFAETIHKTRDESDQPEEESDVLLSAGDLLSPILGTGVRIQDVTRYMVEATRGVIEEFSPELLNRQDIRAYPLKLVEVLYLKLEGSSKEEQFKYAHALGCEIARLIRYEFPSLKNHQILKGIGLLPPEEIDELMFYGKHQTTPEFCRFLGYIWSGYASEVLGKQFQMSEDPLCDQGGRGNCIFTLDEVPH
ncbi:MAG: hypothetical protein ACFFFG_09205 [Candidatus Thorarchaeota archaeon]